MRLERIAQLPQNTFLQEVAPNSSLRDCAISEEIANFKSSCFSKARQATDLADNVQQSCVIPLEQLIQKQV